METEDFKRTLIYMRVSSWGQVGKDHVSLDVQEKSSRARAFSGNGKIDYVLKEEAKSGKDIDNPQYLRMLALVEARQIDTVVVWALDRIGRDAAEYFALMRRFDHYGVKLVSATQDLENRMFAGMLMVMAEEESRKISGRVRPSQQARLDSGRWIGRAPLGYKIAAHPQGGRRLEQDPETAWKVLRLFDLYATGEVGLTKLVQEAALLGVGGGQSKSNLSRMLTNASYVGKLVWGRRQKVRGVDGKRHLEMQPKSGWTVRDGDHDPIVSQETFAAVQAVLARNQVRKAPRPANRQLLVGSIFCKCGARLQGVVNGKYGSYYCPKRRDRQTCDQRFVAAWKFDAQVKRAVEGVMATFQGPDRALAFAALAELGDEALDQAQIRKNNLEESRQKLVGARLNGADMVSLGIMDPTLFAAQDARYVSQLASVERELADLGDVRPAPNYDAALAMSEVIQDLSVLTVEEWRGLVQTFVERVDVDGEAAVVTFYADVQPMVMVAERVSVA